MQFARRTFLAHAGGVVAGVALGSRATEALATDRHLPTAPEHGRGPRSLPRVLVSSDIGGTDFDDFQSMVHFLLYADRFDVEGLVSSPYGPGRASDILSVIDAYEHDWPNLRTWSRRYPAPGRLRAITKQGALDIAPAPGYGAPTEGSRWIVECARRRDPRPLNVLVWGGIDDLAQALHDAPDIEPKLRVHYIGGPNKLWTVDAYDYIETHHPHLSIIESNATYRGFFTGGDQSGDLGNQTFVASKVAGHGALGAFFVNASPDLKMGDSPSITWFLQGAQDPARPSWGGQYVRVWDGRKTIFDRFTTAEDVGEVYGVIEFAIPKPAGWRPTNYARMTIGGRTGGPFPAAVDEGRVLRFRFSPRDPKVWDYVVDSDHSALNGVTGAVTAAPPPAWRANRPSRRHPNWWSDDQDPAYAEGTWVGAKHVSQWRAQYLTDFAQRLERCVAPAKHGR
ncbi:DUF1593 domain-containing protein [Streptosporangium sp. 'caverna']|uniref:DUF1593 domain-containing protein n=1 Tax=Streptosporangium sp. 'caverna' TaxID=2202249 RepID=UPI000D7D9F20|nr:DUF1593 domain-containing protein [Streptosporangium sp. 'caverna']AWS47724.1 hypothetical protein DKM19_47005 [Streptosporangium sp. 'caverna']